MPSGTVSVAPSVLDVDVLDLDGRDAVKGCEHVVAPQVHDGLPRDGGVGLESQAALVPLRWREASGGDHLVFSTGIGAWVKVDEVSGDGLVVSEPDALARARNGAAARGVRPGSRIHLDRRRMGHGRSDGQGENDLRSSVGLHVVWCVVVEGTLVVSYRTTTAFDAGVAADSDRSCIEPSEP